MLLPEEYINRIREMLPKDSDLFFDEMEKEPLKGIRVNTLKTSNEWFLKENPWGISSLDAVSWCEDGYYYDASSSDASSSEASSAEDSFSDEIIDRLNSEAKAPLPGKHPFHAAGVYYIQEPSAMSAANEVKEILLQDESLRVLDLCASPGGKSTQLAAYMNNRGLLVSNEINKQRAQNLSENIERMGIGNAIVISHDPAELTERYKEFFDVILVDAPCSGEGMFRKNPDAILEWSPDNVDICIERQQYILDCAYAMLKSGGTMVYSTCTFEKGEDEDGIRAFLDRYSDIRIVKERKLWPFEVKGEGHFLAVLEKDSDGENDHRFRTEKSQNEKDIKEFFDFQKDCLSIDIRDKYESDGYCFIRFKDELYIAPASIPELSRLRVLRPGLHLGTLKKGRFEPSLALALFLKSDETVSTVELDLENAIRYLKGETVSGDGIKGWCLICYKGMSLGWGKASNGIVKNHYPKGLRMY